MKRRLINKRKVIDVQELGEAVIAKKGERNTITVYFVREVDGSKTWQLNPDINTDEVLLTAKVIPLNSIKFILCQIGVLIF